MPSPSIHALAVAFTVSLALFNNVTARSLDALFSRSKSGINCDGSSDCGLITSGSVLPDLQDGVNALPISASYQAGDQLACINVKGLPGGICASVGSNTPTFVNSASSTDDENTTNLAAEVLQDLINHKCQQCGTAPTNRTGNDLSGGSIVVNYVTSLCPTNSGSTTCVYKYSQ